MLAANVMSTDLLTLHKDALLKDAISLFRESVLHEFAVVDSAGKLLGEVSSRSILHRAVPAYASTELLAAMRAGPDIQSVYNNMKAMLDTPLSELMTTDVPTVLADTPTSAVAAELTQLAGDSSHVYVTDGDSKLLGVISAGDIIRRFSEKIQI
ncbi:MAG: CBS domain-containing protein [Mariprofundaceae bacterium]|nr:CBS domain-containing protein [Mariprofundaceae bacterium]